jgi:hypothetical protein
VGGARRDGQEERREESRREVTRGDTAVSVAVAALLVADIIVGLWGGGGQPGVAGWYVTAVGVAWALHRLGRRRGGE